MLGAGCWGGAYAFAFSVLRSKCNNIASSGVVNTFATVPRTQISGQIRRNSKSTLHNKRLAVTMKSVARMIRELRSLIDIRQCSLGNRGSEIKHSPSSKQHQAKHFLRNSYLGTRFIFYCLRWHTSWIVPCVRAIVDHTLGFVSHEASPSSVPVTLLLFGDI